MKKLCLPVLLALFLCCPAASALAAGSSDDPDPSPIPVQIKDTTKPVGPGEGGTSRSLGSSVAAASYDPQTGSLEVLFNQAVGEVTVEVLDGMNRTVACRTCNTDAEPVVYLTFHADRQEVYTIHLIGSEYEGIGYLTLR